MAIPFKYRYKCLVSPLLWMCLVLNTDCDCITGAAVVLKPLSPFKSIYVERGNELNELTSSCYMALDVGRFEGHVGGHVET